MLANIKKLTIIIFKIHKRDIITHNYISGNFTYQHLAPFRFSHKQNLNLKVSILEAF